MSNYIARFNEHEMLRWPDFPEAYGENYNSAVLKRIRNAPRRWLCSLPMYEYAYVALVCAIRKFGGNPKSYVIGLFYKKMLPILMHYYQILMPYRIHRWIHLANYDSYRLLINQKSLKAELEMMRSVTKGTRRMLRDAVCEFVEEGGPTAIFSPSQCGCPCCAKHGTDTSNLDGLDENSSFQDIISSLGINMAAFGETEPNDPDPDPASDPGDEEHPSGEI